MPVALVQLPLMLPTCSSGPLVPFLSLCLNPWPPETMLHNPGLHGVQRKKGVTPDLSLTLNKSLVLISPFPTSLL